MRILSTPRSPRPALIPALVVGLLASLSTSLVGQESLNAPVDTVAVPSVDSGVVALPGPAPVVIGDDTIAFVHGATGLLSAEDRAAAFSDRLQQLRLRRVPSDSVSVDTRSAPPRVLVEGIAVLVVTPADADGLGLGTAAATEAWAVIVRDALDMPLLQSAPRALLTALGLLLAVTLLLWASWRVLRAVEPKLTAAATRIVTARVSSIRFQNFEFVSGDDIGRTIGGVVRLLRWALSLALLAVYFPIAFWLFPSTRVVADRILEFVLPRLQDLGLSVLFYLPNLFNIAVIALVTWKGLDLMQKFSHAVEVKRIRIRGFYPDWARPTFQLFRIVVVAFAVVLIWPYLPNSDSRAFQGVAAFLGLLVTFGSAGAVSNAVGGVVMVYMRPFAIGDRIRIADTMGDVVERGILVTRIRTPKNVVITIPNSQVVSSHLVNYSRVAARNGVILHTTVTIGYEVPWPKVHEALLKAAGEVDGLLDDPGPFVLQTMLGDFTVSYELNAYTKQPERMGGLYSEIHKQIQVAFAEAGIEITSPTWHAVREGNRSTIPPVKESEPAAADDSLGPTGSGEEPAVT